jgi:hypothetical protein
MGRLILGLVMCVSVMARADVSILSQISYGSDYERLYEANGGFSDSDYQRLIGAVNSAYKELDHKQTDIKQMECRETNLWKIQLIKKDIIFARNKINDARSVLADERKAARISGYSSATIRNMAAWMILDKEDRIKQLFAQYKSLGGKGRSAYTLGKPDPFCETLTVQVDRVIPTKDEATAFFADKKAKTDLAAAERVAAEDKMVEDRRKEEECRSARYTIRLEQTRLENAVRRSDSNEIETPSNDRQLMFNLSTYPVAHAEVVVAKLVNEQLVMQIKQILESLDYGGLKCQMRYIPRLNYVPRLRYGSGT